MLLGFDAIHIGLDLRNAYLVIREHTDQLGLLTRLRDDRLRRAIELVVADVRAILELQLEAADGAEALHRRRWEHDDLCVLDRAERAVELVRDVQSIQFLRFALVEVIEREENDGRVRAVGETGNGQSRELHRVRDARCLQSDVADATYDFFGAIERCRIRQLNHRHDVLLVLDRDEAFRHDLEHDVGQHQQAGENAHRDGLVREHAPHAAHVLRAGSIEELIEAAEESAEHAIHAARERIRLRSMRLEQQGRQCRTQRERIDRRDHGRDRDRQRELLVELTGESRDERDRCKHGHQHQRDRNDRAADFLHRLVGGLARRESRFDVALDVLHDDDRIVDDDTDGEHQPEQRQRVDREAERQHQRERADDRDWHGDQRNDRRAPGLQEQDHHQHDQHQGFEQRLDHGLDRIAYEDRRVVHDLVRHAFGEILAELGHGLANRIRELERIGARGLRNRNRDGRLVAEQCAQ